MGSEPKVSEPPSSSLRAPITVFMGVPTMYAMLLRALASARKRRPKEAGASARAASRLRLAVSGSAACPVPVLREWEEVTGGASLLERYGTTEIGMALSNPLDPLERRAGSVGAPLPNVEVDVAPLPEEDDDEESGEAAKRRDAGVGEGGEERRGGAEEGGSNGMLRGGMLRRGELLVRGPGVFSHYWGRPEATAEAFDERGFFRTGDCVEVRRDGRFFDVLGRISADIVKTGGHKVSALEVEAKLLEHPLVAEVAVVGVPDEAYGEVGSAIVVRGGGRRGGEEEDEEGGGLGGGGPEAEAETETETETESESESESGGVELDAEALAEWARSRMAAHKVPRHFRFVDKIPRNAMGKVNKKNLAAELALLER